MNKFPLRLSFALLVAVVSAGITLIYVYLDLRLRVAIPETLAAIVAIFTAWTAIAAWRSAKASETATIEAQHSVTLQQASVSAAQLAA